jgi:alkanesulfonate monooxygenase SsuD/methylene tetrahydromethanopterin reductase-like flavin-dependent oxidoreductase (luciferase family)
MRWKHTRETVEAMRILWTRREASYEGEIVKFPALRSEPKPIPKMGPPVLLGAHGPKALERVARTYDGWMPLVASPEELKASVAELRKLTAARGRDPGAILISPLIEPGEHGPSADDVKRYRDAGASRLIFLSQKMIAETANGKALEAMRRYASSVDRSRTI